MAKPTNPETGLAILCQGQGTQQPEMFRQLLYSGNLHVRNAAAETLHLLRKIKPEVVDTYFDSGVSPAKINDTVNIQPALAAYTIIWHKALKGLVGEKIVPDIAGGFSLGDFTATYALEVLPEEPLLKLACLRGEVFAPIKPGQFYVAAIVTKDPLQVKRLNWALRGTGYRVTLRHADNVATLAGPAESREEFDKRIKSMEESGFLEKCLPLDPEKFYVPFHHCIATKDIATFYRSQLAKSCKRMGQAFMDPRGRFATNDGKLLSKGADIREYLSFAHITNRCDFASTMAAVAKNAQTIIGLGDMASQQRMAARKGYASNFVVVNSESGLEAAAMAYESVLQRRAQQNTQRTPALTPAMA